MQNTDNAISESDKMDKVRIVILTIKLHMFKSHIKVNGRNLSIGMTFIERRAPITGSTLCYDRQDIENLDNHENTKILKARKKAGP